MAVAGAPLEMKTSLKDEEIKDEETGEAEDVVLDPKKERKLLAKLDAAFVPIIMLTYLSCFLDRSNIGEYLSLAASEMLINRR